MLNVDMKHGDGFASLNIAESVTYIANLAEGQFPLRDALLSGHVLKDEGCGRMASNHLKLQAHFLQTG
jgi:hypothetical protein